MASARSHLERATKIAVITSTLGAVVYQALHAGRDWWFLPHLALLAAIAGYAIARRSTEWTTAVVVAFGYVMPAFLLLVRIGFRFSYLSVWMAALMGAMAASSPATVWRYPARLRFPLVAWALAVALSWPLVAIRVLDWNPLLPWMAPSTPSDAVHAIPSSVWVSHVASVHLLGLLWMDWLFGRFAAGTVDRFERLVIRPLLVSATLAAMLAAYQGFADLTFLSLGAWWQIGRATGSLADGNLSGALSALWVATAMCLAMRASSWAPTTALALSAVLLLAATYASGSRTATLCAVVALGAVGHIAVTERRQRRRLLVVVALTVTVTAVGWTRLSSSVTGPILRVAEVLPSLSRDNIRRAAQQLWDREGYGTAATMMISEQPAQGVGVGAFHLMTPEYVFSTSKRLVPADNAQNWFRHQLAELGLLGSLGWIWWCAILSAALLKRPIALESRISSLAAKYTIVGFGLASLLGMPSQSPALSLTVWTFAFWLLLTNEVDGSRGDRAPADSRWPLRAAAVLAVAFAATTADVGWRDLRPPFMAKRFNYLYEYGLYETMDPPAGRTQTTSHAVTVMSAPTPALRLTVWVDHPDADQKPVDVDVWLDGRRVVHGHFARGVPLSRVLQVPGNNQRFVLETRVDRTFRSLESGRNDVGLSVAWAFEHAPP